MLAGLMTATILSAATPAMAQDNGRREWGGTRNTAQETRGDRGPRADRGQNSGQNGGQWQGRQQQVQQQAAPQPAPQAQAQPQMQERRRYMEQRPSGDNGQWRQNNRNNQWQQAQASQAAQQARQTQQRVESSSTLGPNSRAWRDDRRNVRTDGRTIPGSTEGWRDRTGEDRRDRDRNDAVRNPNDGRNIGWRDNDRRDDGRRDDNLRDGGRRDGNWNNDGRRYGNNNNWAYTGGRLNDRQRWQDQRRWDNGWRNDRRYDWRANRNTYRNLYSPGRYYAPRGWSYGYRPFSSGIFMDSMFYSNNYWLDDPYAYRLPPAYGSMRWIRYYDDALLVDTRDGYVVDVIRGFFF